MAKDALKQSGDTFASFTDEALGNRPVGGPTNAGVRAKREVGMAISRLFNPLQELNMATNRAELIKVLVDQVGMSEADATQVVADWTASYNRLEAVMNFSWIWRI